MAADGCVSYLRVDQGFALAVAMLPERCMDIMSSMVMTDFK